MGLFDWRSAETDDEDKTVTLIGYATPEFEENLRASLDRACIRCGEPESGHCSDCGACYDHAGWCPQEGG